MTPMLKPRRCKHCREKFMPERLEQVIHRECIYAYAQAQGEKQRAKALAKKRAEAKVERAITRERRQALKGRNQLRDEAQDAFRKFIRERDAYLPCVSCKTTNPPMLPGGQWDAGHFLSRGAYPELAFDEDNCHKQCKSCNAGSGKFAHKARTVAQSYEEELVRRIGPERLAALKGPHPERKYTKEEFREIKVAYVAKLKALKSET